MKDNYATMTSSTLSTSNNNTRRVPYNTVGSSSSNGTHSMPINKGKKDYFNNRDNKDKEGYGRNNEQQKNKLYNSAVNIVSTIKQNKKELNEAMKNTGNFVNSKKDKDSNSKPDKKFNNNHNPEQVLPPPSLAKTTKSPSDVHNNNDNDLIQQYTTQNNSLANQVQVNINNQLLNINEGPYIINNDSSPLDANTNKPTNFCQYYFNEVRTAFLTLETSYFANIYRDHYFQSYQGTLYFSLKINSIHYLQKLANAAHRRSPKAHGPSPRLKGPQNPYFRPRRNPDPLYRRPENKRRNLLANSLPERRVNYRGH